MQEDKPDDAETIERIIFAIIELIDSMDEERESVPPELTWTR